MNILYNILKMSYLYTINSVLLHLCFILLYYTQMCSGQTGQIMLCTCNFIRCYCLLEFIRVLCLHCTFMKSRVQHIMESIKGKMFLLQGQIWLIGRYLTSIHVHLNYIKGILVSRF